MDGEGHISDYRSRLDKTLTSPDLTNEEIVHTLVKNQILQTMDSQLGGLFVLISYLISSNCILVSSKVLCFRLDMLCNICSLCFCRIH